MIFFFLHEVEAITSERGHNSKVYMLRITKKQKYEKEVKSRKRGCKAVYRFVVA